MTWFSSEKKLKNDESERKYHIIRKMHAFHVFPKTDKEADENKDFFCGLIK